MISGAAAVAGIAGNPITHSLSPVIHNAWLAHAGMDGAYVPFAPTDATGFERLVAAGRAGLIRGLNITAPFKEQAFALADTASAAALRVRSANILVFQGGQVSADSADGLGLMRALAEQAPDLTVEGRRVVVFGAGGAARAALGALLDAGARVSLVNRTPGRAEALAVEFGAGVEAAGPGEALDDAALVINALSVQPALEWDRLPPQAVVMDMTYRPVETPLLVEARRRGHPTVDGLAMLIGQAGPSFEALFNRPPPPLDLRPLLMAHLDKAAS